MYEYVQALNDVYYEPLADVLPSVDAILAGPPVMKLLFMTHPTIVDSKLKPDWQVTYHACVTNMLLGFASCLCVLTLARMFAFASCVGRAASLEVDPGRGKKRMKHRPKAVVGALVHSSILTVNYLLVDCVINITPAGLRVASVVAVYLAIKPL